MKSASAGLVTHLTTGQQFRRAELWTFTLAGGQVLRFTTLDVNVTVSGNTWSANGPVLERPRSRIVAGLEVDKFDVTVAGGAADLVNGLTWPQAARSGAFRGAKLLIERVYMPTWGDVSLGKLYTMGGDIVAARGDGSRVQLTVWSPLHVLAVKYPLDVVQPTCRHTLFDAGCTLSAAAFAVNGTVSAGSTASQVRATLGQADGYFSLGRIVFTSGPNNGTSRSIKKHTAGTPALVDLVIPALNVPSAGETFTLYPGDDKLQSTCTTKFNNLVNFGGEPLVPRPETAL